MNKHFFNDLFRNDKIFLITMETSRITFHRKIYEVVEMNKTVFIEFSRPFPYVERNLIFPQLYTKKENEAFNFYPQYVHEVRRSVWGHDTNNYPHLNWPSINLDFDIPDQQGRCFWIFKI